MTPNARHRTLALATAFWSCLVLTIGLYSVHGGMGQANAVRLPGEETFRPVLFLPQGWRFFTRDAREDRLAVWRKTDDGRWEPATLGSNANAVNLFGLSRRGRVEQLELGILTSSIPKAAFAECQDEPTTCLSAQTASLRIPNTATVRRYCGTYGVGLVQVVPWAWSNMPETPQMPSRTVVVEFTC